ncbi:MAG: hypothetical protein ACI4D5_06365 [Kineothrix sp.]
MIRHKLSFALRLIDDFTGKKLDKTVCTFKVDGRLVSTLYKEEGFYLFFEPMDSPCRLQIEARDYFPGVVLIDRKDIDPSYPVVEVRLYHKPGGQFPYRCSLCCGRIEPPKKGEPFMVYGISGADSGYMLKSVKKVDQNTILELSGYHKEKLTGRVFGLGSEKNLEVFVILEKEGMNDYLVAGSLKRRHKKGDRLFRVYRTYADGEGNYVLPVAEGTEDQITVTAMPVPSSD